MNLSELKSALDAAGIVESAYSFTSDGLGEVYRLARIQDRLGYGWEVYYAERGIKTGHIVFRSEAEACTEFLRRVIQDPTTRRAN
jgi:hypothetical protein